MAPTEDQWLYNWLDKRNNILAGADLKTEAFNGDRKVRF